MFDKNRHTQYDYRLSKINNDFEKKYFVGLFKHVYEQFIM